MKLVMILGLLISSFGFSEPQKAAGKGVIVKYVCIPKTAETSESIDKNIYSLALYTVTSSNPEPTFIDVRTSLYLSTCLSLATRANASLNGVSN